MRPVPRGLYTSAEVDRLDLLDSPCLLVNLGEHDWQPIQTACTALPLGELFPGCLWEYSRTTHEWIPVFYARGNEVYRYIDIESIEVENEYTPGFGGYDHEGMPVPIRCIGKKEYATLMPRNREDEQSK